MEVVCGNCTGKFRVAEDKLPLGQKIAIKCIKCQNKIEIQRTDAAHEVAGHTSAHARAGRLAALICEQDPGVRDAIAQALKEMDYYVEVADSTRTALRHVRFTHCDLVVLNETFEAPGWEQNQILKHIEHLPMQSRRHIFTVLIGNGFSTMDPMAAYAASVNLVIKNDHVTNLKEILSQALQEHRSFYETFNEVLTRMSKII